MANPRVTRPGRRPNPAGDQRPTTGSAEPVRAGHPGVDPIDGAQLLKILEGNELPAGEPGASVRTPRVNRMPAGIEVVEESVGTAVGQWVLRVHCQCGRSWFELEPVHWATCPRCKLLVRVNIDAAKPE